MRLLLHGGPIFTGLDDTAQHGLAVLVEDGQIVVVHQDRVCWQPPPST